jgi:hypothetical protein
VKSSDSQDYSEFIKRNSKREANSLVIDQRYKVSKKKRENKKFSAFANNQADMQESLIG